MYERMKSFLHHCINVVVAMVLISVCSAYVLITGLIMTRVINDLRLDTYVSFDTGFGLVMLILLLGWGPVWLSRSLQDRR
jgi:amino acid permease